MKKYFTVERFVNQGMSAFDTSDDAILSEIQMDYNAIIMSPAFRRMQDKTQVFPLSRGDYVRTRLTHTYEVSIIAEQIARYALIYLERHHAGGSFALWTQNDKDRFVELSKTVALVHDIGNPPFGHFGEDCIRNWFEDNKSKLLFTDETGKMIRLIDFVNASKTGYPLYEDFLKFDGNVQGLRIVLKSHPAANGQGLNLVKSLIHAMVKYPIDSQTAKKHNSKKSGYYYADRNEFFEVQEATQTPFGRHLVTYILEAADDIAYRTADIEDALKKKVITIFDIKKYLKRHLDLSIKNDAVIYASFMNDFELCSEDESLALEYTRNWLQKVRGYLMKSVARQFAEEFEKLDQGLEDHYELSQVCYARNFFEFAKALTREKIYDNEEVLDLEVAAKACMYDLLDLFVDAIIPYDSNHPLMTSTYYQTKIVKLIDREFLDIYEQEKVANDPSYNLYLRILCVLDYVSAMTDRYAYEKRRTLTGTGTNI